MGTLPGQMAEMGKTAKKEANRKWKEGSRCGGGAERPSPLSCRLQEVRLGVGVGKAKKWQQPQKSRDTGTSFHQGEGEPGRPRGLSNLSMPRGHVSTQLHSHARPQAGQGAPSGGHTRSLGIYRSACNTCVCAHSLRQPSQGRRPDPAPVFGTTSLDGQTDRQLQGHTHRHADGQGTHTGMQMVTSRSLPQDTERQSEAWRLPLWHPTPAPTPPNTHHAQTRVCVVTLLLAFSVFQLATSTPGAQMPCVPGASGTGPTAL